MGGSQELQKDKKTTPTKHYTVCAKDQHRIPERNKSNVHGGTVYVRNGIRVWVTLDGKRVNVQRERGTH